MRQLDVGLTLPPNQINIGIPYNLFKREYQQIFKPYKWDFSYCGGLIIWGLPGTTYFPKMK